VAPVRFSVNIPLPGIEVLEVAGSYLRDADLRLLGRYTVSIAKYLTTFRTILMPSHIWSSSPRRFKVYVYYRRVMCVRLLRLETEENGKSGEVF
jgi:hypothetical protein